MLCSLPPPLARHPKVHQPKAPQPRQLPALQAREAPAFRAVGVVQVQGEDVGATALAEANPSP